MSATSRVGRVISQFLRLKVRLMFWTLDKERLSSGFVTVTMRYTHSNLASKVAAVGKLAGTATNLLHLAPKCSSRGRECSKLAANSQNTLELKTEEWVSG